MKVYHSIKEIPGLNKPVVTIGTFDGVHCGHRTILERVKKAAEECRGSSFIFTFHPHPRQILFPEQKDLKLLTDTNEKLDLLEKEGIEHVLVFPFTREFSEIKAEDYVKHLLLEGIGIYKLVIGYDHRFGHGREGDIHLMRKFAGQFGFAIEEISAREIEQVNVSSTRIRRALETGDLKTANSFLGYPYFLSGRVVRGKQLGTQLGFPTANIFVEDQTKLIPGSGIYAVTTSLAGQRYKGMLSIGINPTTDTDNKIKIEVNMFNFDKDIYGERITVYFHQRLRNEEKFASLNDLVEQLKKDKQNALEVL